MYRTGDSARWLHDGVVEFIERQDDQVKLRGFRIELGENEAALAACDEVQLSAVVLRGSRSGGHREHGGQGGAAEPAHRSARACASRRTAKASLPDYMIPSGFVILSELPRLANGKLDRGQPAAAPTSDPHRR